MADLKRFRVGIEWKMYGYCYSEAKDEKEALLLVQGMLKDPKTKYPDNAKFVPNSAIIDHLSIKEVNKGEASR